MNQSSSPTVLVVDDEASLRKALAFDFKRKGFQVLTAENGKEAEAILSQQSVQGVISDVRMPGGDGIAFLKCLRENNPYMPFVILITGFADISLTQAFDIGADAVFAKPFDRKALHHAVSRCLQAPEVRWAATDSATGSSVQETLPDQARVLSLGRGGMFVETPAPFPRVDRTVRFKLSLREVASAPDLPLEGTGIVRWIRGLASPNNPAGCGVEFVTLADSCRDQVSRWITQTPRRPFIPAA